MRGCVSQWASLMPGIREPGDESKTARTGSMAWVASPHPQDSIHRGEVKVRADFPEMSTFLNIVFMYSNNPASPGLILTSKAQRLGNKPKGRRGRRIHIHSCLTEQVLWVHVACWSALHLCTLPRGLTALTSKSRWLTKQTLNSLSSFPRLLQNDSKEIKVQLIYKSKEKRRRTISHLQISVKF